MLRFENIRGLKNIYGFAEWAFKMSISLTTCTIVYTWEAALALDCI
jgi:hypothetical protein